MDPFVIATIILTVWAALGPLVGVRYGNELARRSARMQWLADARTKEWRGLLTVLTTSMAIIVQSNISNRTVTMMEADLRANTAAGEALSNCLFIAQEVRRRELLERWNEAVETFRKDGDPKAFGEKFGRTIRFQIEDGAREDIGRI